MGYVSDRDRDYMREWMRKKRARIKAERVQLGLPPTPRGYNRVHEYRVKAPLERNAEYDPKRDGAPVYESMAARLLGDPPIGRRAIDRR